TTLALSSPLVMVCSLCKGLVTSNITCIPLAASDHFAELSEHYRQRPPDALNGALQNIAAV
ncbi:MAG: hypothetical protein ACLP7P_06240, partial [Rhodomicrobium sp.]